MRKLIQLISASAVTISMMAGAAAADTVTCGNISNTGPGSNNTITCVDEKKVNVTCNNNIVVENTNEQDANSGNAFTTDNTSSGDANSGDANNNNQVTVKLGASCAPVAQTASSTTPAGGKGAGSTSTPASTPAAKPVSLPKTGSDTAQKLGLEGLVALGGTLGLSQVALRAYRRLALR